MLGFALARWPRLTVPLLALAMVDFCLGIGSHVLRELDLADSSILPTNYNPASGFTDSGTVTLNNAELNACVR